MKITKEVNPRFEDFVFDWDYRTYFLVGGYGSSKSYHIALKLILKCFAEVRKVLVVREVYDTIRESCFDLFLEILTELDLLAEKPNERKHKVVYKTSPMSLTFPNGSKVIFKGMDKPAKLKSINNVSIIWMEECSELKYEGFKELLSRGYFAHSSFAGAWYGGWWVAPSYASWLRASRSLIRNPFGGTRVATPVTPD
jgi:phage terminase large subunit